MSVYLKSGDFNNAARLVKPSGYWSQWGELFSYYANRLMCDRAVTEIADSLILQIHQEVEKNYGNEFSQVAFVNIDPQVDFVDGSLGGLTPEIVSQRRQALAVASLVSLYFKAQGALVIASKDHHPENHISFASSHKEASPFQPYLMFPSEANHYATQDYQVVWPSHCVVTDEGVETSGAEFHSAFSIVPHAILTKGEGCSESYSAVFDVYGEKSTPILEVLKENAIKKVCVAGLCTDYCVGHSAAHLSILGFDVTVLSNASAGVSPNALKNLQESEGLLSEGRWRLNINHSETSYFFGHEALDKGYKPCEELSKASSNLQKGAFPLKFSIMHG